MSRLRPTTAPHRRPLLLAVVAASCVWPLTARLQSASATDPAGIRTVAGRGAGRTPDGKRAVLSEPRTAAVDSTGAIWFTDTGHNEIRRLDPATGLVTVVDSGRPRIPAARGRRLRVASGGAAPAGERGFPG